MADGVWFSLAESYTKDNKDDGVKEIVTGVLNRNISLLELVQFLGQSLTSSDIKVRGRGIQLLTEVLSSLAPDALTEKEVEVCIEFMCQRLKDHHSIIPSVVSSLKTLGEQKHASGASIGRLVRGLFSDVQTQMMVQKDRHVIYSVILFILEHRLQDVLSLGGDFVFGFVQTMDGEKDPRNLTLAFRCVSIIARNFDLCVFSEELFEVVSCYFPIEFTPPPDDPHAVTQQDLVSALRDCLSASSAFAQYGYPLLLEKLTSDVKSSQLDALLTMCACMEVYGASSLQEYTSSILNTIRRIVFVGLNADLTGAALRTLGVMAATLYSPDHTKPLDDFINEVWQDCRPYLEESDSHSVGSSSRLMEAVIRGAPYSTTLTLQHVFTLAVKLIFSQTQVTQRCCLLDMVASFVQLCTDLNLASNASLVEHKEALFSLGASLVSDTSPQLRQSALSLLQTLSSVPHLLSNDQTLIVARHMLNILTTDDNITVRKATHSALPRFASSNPEAVHDVIITSLSPFLNKDHTHYQPSPPPSDNSPGAPLLSRSEVMEVMSEVAVCPHLVEVTVPLLIGCLNQLTPESETSDQVLAESLTCCGCLRSISSHSDHSSHFLLSYLYPHCLHLALRGSLGSTQCHVMQSPDVLLHLNAIVQNIVQILDARVADDVVNKTVSLFIRGENFNPDIIQVNTSDFKPLLCGSPWQHTRLLCLLQAVLCSVPSQVTIPDLDSLLPLLLAVSCDCDHVTSSNMAAKCLAGIINKLPPGQSLDQMVTSCQQQLKQCSGSEVNVEKLGRVVTCYSWLTKALVLRGHSAMTSCLLKLCDWLTSETLGGMAADGFGIVLRPFEDVMTTSQHAVVTLLHQQRLMITTLPVIKLAYHNTGNMVVRQNHLKALSYILQFTPRSVIQAELPELVPLLVHSIQGGGETGSESLLSSLSTLYDLTMDSPSALTAHIDDLIPRYLLLSDFKSSLVRIQALRCLGAMTTVQLPSLTKHHSTVSRSLVTRLNDHKRLVRKEAARARSEWLLMDS